MVDLAKATFSKTLSLVSIWTCARSACVCLVSGVTMHWHEFALGRWQTIMA